MIDKLRKKYAEQDNRCTAFPIYVTAQELQFVAVGRDGYGGAGDCVDKYEYTHPLNDEGGTWKSKDDVVEWLKDYHDFKGEKLAREIENIEDILCVYRWTDVEVFLTIEGAEEYIKANKHNLGETRTYVKHFSRRNFEMRALMAEMGFRVKD